MRPGLTKTASVGGMVAVSVAAVLAQQPPGFRSRVHTVEVHATVRGSDGQFVSGLTKDDFELYDNGKRREITVFSADVQPITVALVLDRSGSVARQAGKITAAAETFVGRLNAVDRAAVHTLVYECQSLTSNKLLLTSMLRSSMQIDLGSPIWSGLDRTLSALTAASGRRAILLFSDGQDAGPLLNPPARGMGMPGPCRAWPDPSEATFTDASKRAEREGVMVYTVSVDSASGMPNDGDLRAIARGSGGERYRLKDESELSAAFTRIVDELHHQYLLGFVPEVFDGKVHPLTVRVKRTGLSVRARESYVAIELDRPASRPGDLADAPRPLSSADVDRAIRDGAAGQKAHAMCMAFGTFPNKPEENDVFAEVVLEGPAGRIMRAAREARAQRLTFDAAHVTDAMRAPVLQVTAEMKRTLRPAADPQMTDPMATPTPTPAMTPTPTPTATVAPTVMSPSLMLAVVSLRVRSKVLTEVLLQPLPARPVSTPAAAPPRALFSSRRVELFDLAAFRALPGPDVEVVVRSPSGPRYCSLSAKDRAAIR